MQFVIIFEVLPAAAREYKLNFVLSATNFEFIRSKSIIYYVIELSVVYFPVPWKRVSATKDSRSHSYLFDVSDVRVSRGYVTPLAIFFKKARTCLGIN